MTIGVSSDVVSLSVAEQSGSMALEKDFIEDVTALPSLTSTPLEVPPTQSQ
jgi:hypothetical protein